MYNEQFARQYRCKPPSKFPLTLLFTGIVHHLSGPIMRTHTQTFQSTCQLLVHQSQLTFSQCTQAFATNELARMSDSLIRVSRRGGQAINPPRAHTRAKADISICHKSIIPASCRCPRAASSHWSPGQDALHICRSGLIAILPNRQRPSTSPCGNLAKYR